MQLMSRAGDYPDDGEVERHALVVRLRFYFDLGDFLMLNATSS